MYQGVLKPWRNCTLTTDARQQISEALQEHFGIPQKAVLAVVETLLPYSEKLMTDQMLRTVCFQFAANWKTIKSGVPVQKFTGVPQAQWLPVEIKGFEKQERGRFVMARMHVEILDGTFAGFRAARTVPFGYLPVFANDMGFSRRRPYDEPVDLLGIRFVAWVEPSAKEDIQFDKYWLTSSIEGHNAGLVKSRKPTQKEIEEGAIEVSDSEC